MALVAVGGVVGAVARYALDQALPTAGHGFPTATLVANLVGAFFLGCLLEGLAGTGGRSERLRLLVGTGLLGAFTTVSTFATEVLLTLRAHHLAVAGLYLVVTAVGGLVAAAVGVAVSGRVRR